MTAQHAEPPAAGQVPPRTLDAVVRILESCGDAEVVAKFNRSLTEAWEAAREGESLNPLLEFVGRWWPEAVMWATRPEETRALYERMRRAEREGLPPYSRDQIAAKRAARQGGTAG